MLDGDGRNAVFDHVYVHAGAPGTSPTSSLTLMAQWLQVRPVALTVVIAMMVPFGNFGITKLVDVPPACQLRIMRDMAAVASFIFSSTIVVITCTFGFNCGVGDAMPHMFFEQVE